MNAHPHKADLLAYLDGRPIREDRPRVAAHVEQCAWCEERLDGLREASRRFSVAARTVDEAMPGSGAFEQARRTVGATDRTRAGERAGAAATGTAEEGEAKVSASGTESADGPAREDRGLWRRVFPGRGRLARAAAVILLVAAGSFAIPGSPLRAWGVELFERVFGGEEPTAAAVQPAPEPGPTEEEARPAGSGASVLPEGGSVTVVLRQAPPGTTVRVRLTDAAWAEVGARGAAYRTEPGRLEASLVGSDTVEVTLPRSVARAIVMVNDELLVEKDGGRFASPIPGAQRPASGELLIPVR